MKIIWKPLDIMGKRLYRVVANWRGQRSHHIIAADAPRHAAAIYLENIGPARDQTDAIGFALQVGQPADWFDQRTISSLDCKHNRTEGICSSRCGHEYYHVFICMDCGRITVLTVKEGKHCRVEFGLNCDQHLVAASKYHRSEAEQKDALARSQNLRPSAVKNSTCNSSPHNPSTKP